MIIIPQNGSMLPERFWSLVKGCRKSMTTKAIGSAPVRKSLVPSGDHVKPSHLTSGISDEHTARSRRRHRLMTPAVFASTSSTTAVICGHGKYGTQPSCWMPSNVCPGWQLRRTMHHIQGIDIAKDLCTKGSSSILALLQQSEVFLKMSVPHGEMESSGCSRLVTSSCSGKKICVDALQHTHAQWLPGLGHALMSLDSKMDEAMAPQLPRQL